LGNSGKTLHYHPIPEAEGEKYSYMRLLPCWPCRVVFYTLVHLDSKLFALDGEDPWTPSAVHWAEITCRSVADVDLPRMPGWGNMCLIFGKRIRLAIEQYFLKPGMNPSLSRAPSTEGSPPDMLRSERERALKGSGNQMIIDKCLTPYLIHTWPHAAAYDLPSGDDKDFEF